MNSNKNESQWLPCEDGAIVGAAGAIRSRENQQSRRQFLRSAAAATVLVAGAGFAGWSVLGQGGGYDNPNFPGGIACSEVKKFMAKYIAGSLNNDMQLAAFEAHLPECAHCQNLHDTMIQNA